MTQKHLWTIIIVIFSNSAIAGFFSTTSHSRANCVTFNESVTWNGTEHHWWRVQSLHTSEKGERHMVDTQMAYTWRDFQMTQCPGRSLQSWYSNGTLYMWARMDS